MPPRSARLNRIGHSGEVHRHRLGRAVMAMWAIASGAGEAGRNLAQMRLEGADLQLGASGDSGRT